VRARYAARTLQDDTGEHVARHSVGDANAVVPADETLSSSFLRDASAPALLD
jgi:hypothetical protein